MMTDSGYTLLQQYDLLWSKVAEGDCTSGESLPNLKSFVMGYDSIRPAQLADLVMLDQMRSWQVGRGRCVEEYLIDFPILNEHQELVIDLAFSEYVRREEVQSAADVTTFLDRFPGCREELERQIAFHRSLNDVSNVASQEGELSTERFQQRLQIPGYEILREIGRGGLGVVYLARDTQLHRSVAIKMLLAGKFASENVIRRLATEGEATARLQHPNIVQIYEVGSVDGHPYLVLEYLQGDTLASKLAGTPQSPQLAAKMTLQVALAVQFAHERGVLHRDLKPSNLLIQDHSWPSGESRTGQALGSSTHPDGRQLATPSFPGEGVQIKVADFGLAKFLDGSTSPSGSPATMTGDLVGTAAYMSPEQAQGQTNRLTPATDVYSIGAILYEMLTGRPPFVGVHPLEVIKQVIGEEPANPSHLVRHIPRDLQTICLKCLEKNPARRYVSCAELASELQRFLSDQPIIARHASPFERAFRWCRRNPGTTTVGALVFVVLTLIVSFTSLYNFMLRNQLSLIKNANEREKELRIEAVRELWDSSMTQAESAHLTQKPGQRYQSLQTIQAASEIATKTGLGPGARERMSNGIISALALPDLREIRKYSLPSRKANEVYLSSQPNLIAFQDDNRRVTVYDSDSKSVMLQVVTLDPIRRVELSRDGKYLLVLHSGFSVYRLQSGSVAPMMELPKIANCAMDWMGTLVIGVRAGGEIISVSLDQPEVIKELGESEVPFEMALSPNHEWLALRVRDAIHVIELKTQKLVLNIPAPFNPEVACLQWHPDSQLLAIGPYSDGIALWNIRTGEKLRSFGATSGPIQFTFSRQGTWLLGYDRWRTELSLWCTGTGERMLARSGIPIQSMTTDESDGFHLVRIDAERTAYHEQIEAPWVCTSLPCMLSEQSDVLHADMDYSHDGRLFACTNGSTVSVYETQTMTLLGSIPAEIAYLQFVDDYSLLTLSKLGLHHWPIQAATVELQNRELLLGPPRFLSRARHFSPFEYCLERELIAVSDGNSAFLYPLRQEGPMVKTKRHNDVRRVSLTAAGDRLATGGWNGGDACLWDTTTGELIHTVPTDNPSLIQMSPSGDSLVVAAEEIIVWNTATWQPRYKVKVQGQTYSGVCICYSEDGHCLAVSDALGQIHLLESETGREFALLKSRPHSQVMGMKFHPLGSQLATITNDGMIQFWQLDRIKKSLEEQGLPWRILDGRSPSIGELPPSDLASERFMKDQRIGLQFDDRFRQLHLDSLLRRANTLCKMGSDHATKRAIDRIIAMEPSRAESLNALAWMLVTGPMVIRDPSRACELAKRAWEDTSVQGIDHVLYQNTYAVALYRLRRFEDAKVLLEENVAQAVPECLVFDLFFLAMCHAQLGQWDLAESTLLQGQAEAKEFRRRHSFEINQEVDDFAQEAAILISTASVP